MPVGEILSIDEIGHGRRRVSWDLRNYNLALDEPERSTSRFFRIVTDTATLTESAVLQMAWDAGLGFPAKFDPHPDDPLSLAMQFSLEEQAEPERWVATVEYALFVHPADEPGLWTTTTGQSEYAVEAAYSVDGEATVDANGNPTGAILNAAGDPFLPPLTIPESYLVLSCTQNFLTIDEANIVSTYLHHVSNAPFRGHATGLVYMAEFSAENAYRQGTDFKRCKFVFHVKKRGWNQKPLNCGFQYIDSNTGTLLTARNARDGQPVSDPILLDLDGQKLGDGQPPVFLNFGVFPTADFTGLGLTGR